ncbi:DNA-binding IclR family transcriptional regulator [Amycolatopsis bartoniae]|uniref:Glycerol operon regulatory protein n=1 Tax=Amycolatopsis bartoniae TaxID=941986 RepID=A0A8H9ME07_9PSEU|nr:IclR family transcriptional regulator [Amycolatopsis bartoniae]MBB2939354.1 DNA-binding IclR family transcriptional regulator [Amycolatopsis bartoniae]TVT06722.1 IclR family transcriptional regulator [Amycolatopsis bartoniae]GHF83653.1 IclR family transcriptional regulator [Amycolatopsis bartoniae]
MPGPIQSIERAAAILRLLARGSGRLGLADIAAGLGLAKGTAHGLLRTLQGVGFVHQDPVSGKYSLGDALSHLGPGYLDANDLRSRASNWADALAARSGEAVRLGVPGEGSVLVVHHVFRPDDTQQSLDVGSSQPLHATALGKVLLAFDADLARTVLSGAPEPYTRRTLTAGPALAAALARIREADWAAEVEEFVPGEAGVAAPVRSFGGLVVGAIGITGAVDRLCDTRGRPRPVLVRSVLDAALAVSRDLETER